MITKVHKLVKSEFQSENRVGLQYYVECSCGFQGRLGTKQAAESQFDNHLVASGTKLYFSKLPTGKDEWKPVGAK
jgi:hypothetical protein